MKRNYNLELSEKFGKKTAKAMIVGANASLKFSTEICNQIKGKPVKAVRSRLERILAKEDFLPLVRYNKKVGHRVGNSQSGSKSGRYPEKTVKSVIKLLDSAMANADYKGLDSEKMIVLHAFACMAFGRPSYQTKGHMGGKMRRKRACHIEVVLAEAA